MPRHSDRESKRVADQPPAGEPAFWPQEDFPQGILDGDFVRYVAETELWERESAEDYLAELKAYFDTIYAGGSSYIHPNHTGEVTSDGDGATTIANKQTLTATAPLAVTNSPKVIASAAPVLSISAATTDAPGSMSAADKTRLDGMEDLAVALTTVKADSDIADALSKAHAAGSDDQDLSGLVTKESTSPDPTGYLPEYDATGNLVKSSKLSSSVHAALTIDGTSPLSLSGQAISLKNDAAAAITEVDTGTLANSDTVVPTSKAVTTKFGLYLPLAGGTMSGDIAMASGKGIDFSATSDAAGKTSEILNDYEEGTWSPVFIPATGSFTTMTMYREAAYRKIGNLVFISALIATNNVNVAGASGNLYVSGLPFTVATHSSLALSYAFLWPGAYPCGAMAYGTTTYITVYKRSAADGAISYVQVSDLQTGEYAIRNRIYISGFYPVSA